VKTALALCLLLAAPAAAGEELLRGSVVKSDRWKMDRNNNTETFSGNVSFSNDNYVLKSSTAVFYRAKDSWDLWGGVYMLKRLPEGALVEARSEKARYREDAEEAELLRGALPVRMKYRGPDGRVLTGASDAALAENKRRQITFSGGFSLDTDNLRLSSSRGLYDDAAQTFLFNSPEKPPLPLARGKREGYDFAIAAENIKFFRDSRDIKFYNKVSGWVKNHPPPPQK
jgi:hypothetical protein